MSHAKTAISTAHYAVSIDASGHKIVSDEPRHAGGENAGPAPYDLLLASLGACTLITLRMYADRKRWTLSGAHADLDYVREDGNEHIRRRLRFDGALTEEQRARLADIAEKTPITLTLKRGLSISTMIDPPLASQQRAADLDARLDEALDESFPASDSPRVDP